MPIILNGTRSSSENRFSRCSISWPAPFHRENRQSESSKRCALRPSRGGQAVRWPLLFVNLHQWCLHARKTSPLYNMPSTSCPFSGSQLKGRYDRVPQGRWWPWHAATNLGATWEILWRGRGGSAGRRSDPARPINAYGRKYTWCFDKGKERWLLVMSSLRIQLCVSSPLCQRLILDK